MTLAKRLGWGMAALLLVLAAAFALMVRIVVNPPASVKDAMFDPTEVSAAQGGPALIVPVAGVKSSQLSDTWGQSRSGGTREHHAIDIIAPKGTLVLAAAAGTVEKIFDSAAGGHTIYIRTTDGRIVYYYAHLDAYGAGLHEGQPVRQGDAIATVGDTGNAAGGAPHLHFEIKVMQPGERWWQGININPYPLLAGAGARR